MRIISGKWRGRSLFFPKSKAVRPTQDRVREAIFSKLQGASEQARVLDLCCGTGSLGLEALSRGAGSAHFVDVQTQVVKRNIAHLDCQSQSSVITQRAPTFLKRTSLQFDLIFLDPPWQETALYEASLKAIYDNDILSDNGQLVVEFRRGSPPNEVEFSSVSTYGDTAVTVLTYPLLKHWVETVPDDKGSA